MTKKNKSKALFEARKRAISNAYVSKKLTDSYSVEINKKKGKLVVSGKG